MDGQQIGLSFFRESSAKNRMSTTNVEKKGVIAQILGQPFQTTLATSSAYASQAFTSYTSSESGSYMLEVLFYFVVWAFVAFLILTLVHFTVTPVFRFNSGDKGLIGVPLAGDDKIYWTNKTQPGAEDATVPLATENLATYPFDNNFTMSVDLYLRNITETVVNKRLIFIKAEKGVDLTTGISTTSLKDYLKDRTSMAVYLNDNNNLQVIFFSGPTSTEYASRPIENIPIGSPFRLTISCETKSFTVYINGKQAFQRFTAADIVRNSNSSAQSTDTRQVFHSLPLQFQNPRIAYFQNLHLWPRALTATEVQTAMPNLAKESDFDLPPDINSGSCA